MKKIFSFIIILFFTLVFSQENTEPQKYFFGVQAGFLGLNAYNESPLTDRFVLRSEIDLTGGIWGGDLYSKTGFALIPTIVVAPKFYYNINKRNSEKKNTKNNSANYISANLRYVPNWFVISNVEGLEVNPSISLIPTWGLRRNFSNNFNYELQLGIGVGKVLKPNYDLQVIPNISFRIGYDF